MTHGIVLSMVYFYLWSTFTYGIFLPIVYFYLWCIFTYGIFVYLLFLFKVYFAHGKFISIIGIGVCF